MQDIIATALISQEQMNVNTAFDFIAMAGTTMSEKQSLCMISPQRARKEIAKREAVGVAAKQGCSSILFIRDGIRFHHETLNRWASSGKDVIGGRTEGERMNSDLLFVKLHVFEKIKKPWFGTGFTQGSIDTVPDYSRFFEQCEKADIKVYTDEELTKANQEITPTVSGNLKVNLIKIKCRNPAGETIAIAFPTDDLIYTHTASDLAEMVAANNRVFKDIILVNVQSDEIETGRNVSVEVARQQGADRILFVDSDMRFPETALMRLIKRKKDIIGVNAVKRDGTNTPIFNKNLFGKKFNYKKGDTEQVGFIGMGVTLISMSVFEKVPKPWFYPNYKVDSDEWRGEDYTFSWEAKKAGYPIWCDTGLSKEIGHIGAQAYYLQLGKK